jgi:hypothetical protein
VTSRGDTPPRDACPPPPGAFDYAWQYLNEGCQDVRDYDVRPVCGEEARTGDIQLTVSPATVNRTGEVTVALHSEGNTGLTLEALDIRLFHWYQGYWAELANSKISLPGVPPEVEVPIGETEEWTIKQDTDALGDPLVGHDLTVTTKDFPVRLPPGVYAAGFEIGDARYTERFEVTGERFGLQPSNAVAKTFRQDDTLVVRREPTFECESSQSDNRIALLLDRRPAIPEAFTRATLLELYTPWLSLQRPGAKRSPRGCELLRDAFAHDTGSTSRIRVETRAGCWYPIDLDQDVIPGEFRDALKTVVYDETAWDLSWADGWIDQ